MTHESTLFSAKKGIIIAADVPSISRLSSLAELACDIPEVVAIKIGFALALRFGLKSVVSSIKNVCNFPIIYDHQKAATDIPSMGRPFAEVCYEAGVESVIFFPQAGPKTLDAFVSASLNKNLVPIIGLIMTHSAYLQSEGGFITDDAPVIICKKSIDVGVKHFVLPGTKPDLIKRFAEGQLSTIRPASILMPGIGTQGGEIASTFKSVVGHNPYAIIGSAVYNASNPKDALQQFAKEIK